MFNIKKWPRKYQWLLLFFVFFLILFLSPNKSYAEETQNHKENYGQKLIKGATRDALAATLSFIGAGHSLTTGNIPVALLW